MKNFLFDLYGTLVDIDTDESSRGFWKGVVGLLKTGNPDAVKKCYTELCSRKTSTEGEEFDLLTVMHSLIETFGSDYGAEQFAAQFRKLSNSKLRLFEGAAEMLDGLRAADAKTYLLSNAQACFTRGELDILGLSGKFDGIMLSSEAGWKKPSEKFFKAAFERFSLIPQNCIYIGNDLRDDVLGARSVGMKSVYIPTAQSGKYQEEIKPDFSVQSHAELAALLYGLAE